MPLRTRERRTLQAFAEALLPGAPGMPGAARVDIARPVAVLLSSVSGRVRFGVRAALLAFELTTFPRRFSRLPPAARERHLDRLDRGSAGLRRELFVLLKSLSALAYGRDPAVVERVGWVARCETGPDADRLPPRPLSSASLEPPTGVERCDVVVVGSGAAGAAAARVLAEAGLSVIVVEEGGYHDASDYSTDPLQALAALYREGGLTVAEGRPPIPLPVGRCVGGTTVINSGTCFRTPDSVLARWRDERGIPWATDLDAEFESLERDLAVTPVDPATAGRNAELCRLGAEAIGASNGPIARNAGKVVCCGACPTGCTIDAKRAMHVSELPRAVASGARLRAGARAERVIVAKGRAAGVGCRTDGGRYEVRAGTVVLAGGALGTPELLLAQGLANSSGLVGRALHIHPACWVGARFDDPVRGWDGVMQSWYVDEWSDRGLFMEATFTPLPFGAHWLPGTGEELERRIASYDHLAIIGVHVSERSSHGRVTRGRTGTRIGYRLSTEDAEAMRFGIARAAEIHFAAGAVEVYPQLAGLGVLARGEPIAAVENGSFGARDLRLEAFHPMGTAAMGSEPRSSVVSPSGEAHDLPGLFVVDASILPTSLGVNPMITIMACARRMARGLAESWT